LAQRIGEVLGSEVVITTASDVRSLPAIDLIGEKEGWFLERSDALTAVSAALVNSERLALYQDAGRENWMPDPLPIHVERFHTLEDMQVAGIRTGLVITYRSLHPELYKAVPELVVYRPKCLCVGVGCNRGTQAIEICEAVEETFKDSCLSLDCLTCIATVEDKAGEEGILEACHSKGWKLEIFSREVIRSVRDLPNPSAFANLALGIRGVAEPAALLAAKTDVLLVEKRKFNNVTIAIGLRK